jgi:hypothetical protein
MRFQYNSKVIAVENDGKAVFYTKDAYLKLTQVIPGFEADPENFRTVEERTEESIKKLEVSGYKKFLEVIQKETSSKTDKVYYVFYSQGYYLIIVREVNKKPIAKVYYKPENQQISDLMEKMLELQNGKSRAIIANSKNSFNFLTANPILKTLFVYTDLTSRNEIVFAHRKKRKKNGKIRKYIAPHPEIIKPLQELNTILQKIYDRKNIDFQVAYKKGKSIVDNAKIHVKNEYLYNVDLSDFFPSCKRSFVEKYINLFFKNSANSDTMQNLFLDIILEDDALFIGNPISGTLANAIISKPVSYIKNITNGFGMGFSVYADDMSFSSDKFISEEFVKSMFQVAFTRYGMDSFFTLNDEKSHGMSKNRRRVTGVSLNINNEATVSRNFYRDLRVKIHKLSIGEININIQKLRGRIAFATMIDESGKILRLLEKFEPTVKQFNLISDEKLTKLKANGGI